MEYSFLISIGSAVVALLSACISGVSLYISTSDRRLKENPFFILNQSEYDSEYAHDDLVDPIFYNFIYAADNVEKLQKLKVESVKKFRKELDVRKNSPYVEIENSGGIGKNISIVTKVLKPSDLMESEGSAHPFTGWDYRVIHDSSKDNYSLFSNYENNQFTISNLFEFHEGIETTARRKGVSAGSKINIRLPKEFVVFMNLYCNDVIKEKPKAKVTISGRNVFNKKFKDELEIQLDRMSDKNNSEKRYLLISLKS